MKKLPHLMALVVILALITVCKEHPTTPYDATRPIIAQTDADKLATTTGKGGGKGGGGSGKTVQLSMSGNLIADTQTIRGRNDKQTISVKDEYILTMKLDLTTLECGDKPGTIPDEPGLIAFVQSQTPRNGTLSLKFDKTDPELRSVDSWETVIGKYKYVVQFFGWQSIDFIEQSDGTTVVNYRGGSVEVFKKKGGRFISREQCFGQFVDYELIAK